MVAKIESGKSLSGALNYNEHKVKAQKAKLIGASGFAKSTDQLTFQDKLFRLTDLAERNIRTKTNTVHLSLNFDVQEKLDTATLRTIADEYMKRIGFEDQPYLVYQHSDAGHPHLHLLTTNIKADGQRISLNKIGVLRSEPARKAIELEFGLVRAEQKSAQHVDRILSVKPIQYGMTDTKRAISNIVNAVAKNYKYTSLPEFNAILGQYNVTAYRGSKESTMYKNGGLNYWVTDSSGQRVGVPIKASSIYHKPTLKLLETRFRLNTYLRKPLKDALQVKIDKALKKSGSLAQFKTTLEQHKISLVIRQNEDGRVYGLSYIDQQAQAIFNGSDLGKAYSACAINAILAKTPAANISRSGQDTKKEPGQVVEQPAAPVPGGRNLLEDLLAPDKLQQELEGQFGPMKKKKKRKKLNL